MNERRERAIDEGYTPGSGSGSGSGNGGGGNGGGGENGRSEART
ncbi:hypothetical protein [Streptomyces lydicus]|nr:hypothetical protein [Streptomyces lydicus]